MCGFPGIRPRLDLCEVCLGLLAAKVPHDWERPAIFCRALVPFQYAYPIDNFIRALKFRGERRYARILGTLLANEHRKLGLPLPQLLVPVPLHPSRYRERGFNQACEIARFAGAELGVRVDSRCLSRKLFTQEQSGLPLAERQLNVRDAFGVVHLPRARHIALVDDVLTTGNTGTEAARPLAAAGIRKIEFWAVARVALK